MKIIDIEPGTDAWHKWRSEGIGASDIGVLMKDNPYRTPYQLWEKKCGYAKPTPLTGPMRYGIANEDVARRWINDHERVHLEAICIESDDNCAYKASLDGWDEHRKILVEIKCPVNRETIENARVHSMIHKHWYDQIQWQMMIAGPETAYFAIYDPEVKGCIMLQQWPDMKLQERMREAADEFMASVKTGVAPALSEKDYKAVEDPQLEVMLKEYELLWERERDAKKQRAELRDPIASFGDGDNFKAYGWAVRFTPGRVSYDHAKMEQDGIDLSKYEKKGNPSFKIDKVKGE